MTRYPESVTRRASRWRGRLERVLGAATETEWRFGRTFYPDAHRLADELGARYSAALEALRPSWMDPGQRRAADLRTAAGVFAGLSPLNVWEDNWRDAEAVLAGDRRHRCRTTSPNVEKARRIAAEKLGKDFDAGAYYTALGKLMHAREIEGAFWLLF